MKKNEEAGLYTISILSILLTILTAFMALDHDPQGEYSENLLNLIVLILINFCFLVIGSGILMAGFFIALRIFKHEISTWSGAGAGFIVFNLFVFSYLFI